MNLLVKQIQTHRHRKQVYVYQKVNENKLKIWDQQAQTTKYKINNKIHLQYSTGTNILY